MHGDGAQGWRRCIDTNVGSMGRFSRADIERLADRLRTVQLESCDAVDLLNRTASNRACAVYADPPYPSADTSPYAVNGTDIDRLAAALRVQQGAVAVSGYGSEWDMLGWVKVVKPALRRNIGKSGRGASERTETLWLNGAAMATNPQADLREVIGDGDADLAQGWQ